MAEEDIYGSKRKYLRFLGNLDGLLIPAPVTTAKRGRRLYHCRNRENLQCFRELHRIFESRDLSYIRRNRLFDTLRFVTFVTEKNLAECERRDIDEIAARGHKVNNSAQAKESFIKNLKCIWSALFPEVDKRGRTIDEIKPYVVRHLSSSIDKSKQRLRNDRLTLDEYETLVSYFSYDAEMQAFITLAVESLGRPQEICYRLIRDVEMHESYAKIYVSSHGKEGTKFLQCIDSLPYLVKWLSQHPFQHDPDSYLFLARKQKDRMLTPANVNKKIRNALRNLGIEKDVTCYSLKRNGVSFRRLNGDTDAEIQHVAGWTSTRQLATYDLTNADDILTKQLERRGILDKKVTAENQQTKTCVCGAKVGFSEKICDGCKRVVDSKKAADEIETRSEMEEIFKLALKEPDRSLAEIIEEYRRRKLE